MWQPAALLAAIGVIVVFQDVAVRAAEQGNSDGKSGYVSENILHMWGMSHLGDFHLTWTDVVTCPPGSFITAYKLDYGQEYGYLQHMSLACSHMESSKLKASGPPVQILNVGVTNVSYSLDDLALFVLSSDKSYAVGMSYSTYKRELKLGPGVEEIILVDLKMLFQGWSSPGGSSLIQVDPPVNREMDNQMSYGVCTKDFALCGVRAEVHMAELFSHIEAHIRRLEFFCCYICSPTLLTFHRGTIRKKTSEMIRVPIGVEFAEQPPPPQQQQTPPSNGLYNLEKIEKLISPTFGAEPADANSVKLLPPFIAESRHRDPPPISHPLLTHKYSLPISVHLHHSSFGAEIGFRPTTKAASHRLSSLKSENNNCTRYDNFLNGTHSRTDEKAPRRQLLMNSWNNSAILRTVWDGARNMMIREASQGQHSSAPQDHHYWEMVEASTLLDVYMETGSFVCDLENGCSLYQIVRQCGSVRVFLRQFCLHNST